MFSNRICSMLSVLLALGLCDSVSADDKGPVFPGAKGFGIHTAAGRGGKIIRVTNLNSEGPGSLRQALNTKGPRIIVSEVGGVIDVNKNNLIVSEPFLTLAGQTAPSPGITIIRGGIIIRTHDVLVQHIRVRTGDAGQPKRSGWEPDAISVMGADAYNVVIDHCSVSWAVDENLTASGPRHEGYQGTSRNVTFSNCIIAEGLYDSSHHKGPHSKGTLIHDHCNNIAVIGNLYASNMHRNPMFKPGATGVVVNNLIYNPGNRGIYLAWTPDEYIGQKEGPKHARVSVVANMVLYGPNTREGLPIVEISEGRGDVFMADNIGRDRQGKAIRATPGGEINLLKESSVWPEPLEVLPVSEVFEHVLVNAGACPKDRDVVDKRIIQEVRDGRGRIIDSQQDVGGYPRVEMTTRKLDIPTENVDAWLTELTAQIE